MLTLSSQRMLWLWLVFGAIAGGLLLLHGKLCGRTIGTPVIWFCIGMVFVAFVYPVYEYEWFGARLDESTESPGADASMMFVAAYLMEYALSFDAVIVIALLCRIHRVPAWHQPRVLLWSLAGMLLIRFVILFGAACLVRAVSWSLIVFGTFMLISAFASLRFSRDDDIAADVPTERWLSRKRRLAKGDYDGAFVVVHNRRLLVTMAGACVLATIRSDVAFALDSIALLSVSKTSFVVVAACLLATIAQRSWLYAGFENLRSPRKATAALLALIALKMLAYERLQFPHALWLALIAGLLCLLIVEATRHRPPM